MKTLFILKFILFSIIIHLNMELLAINLKLVTIYYPPYIYKENNEIKGFSVDIVKNVFQKMNQRIHINIQPWLRSQQDIKDGSADVIFTIFKSIDRELFMDFNRIPIVYQNISFYVRSDVKIKYDGDFKKISPNIVGVVKGVNYGPLFTKAINEKILPTEDCTDYEKCILKLHANRTKVIIANEIIFKYITNKLNIKQNEFKKLIPRVESVPSYIAFTKKKDLSEIRKRFDIILRKMKTNGEYDKIVRKWSGIDK